MPAAGVPSVGVPGSFGMGAHVLGALQQQGIRQTGFQWVYGSASRENPFPEHRALAGEFVESMPTGPGFSGFGWSPGDHKGCLCSARAVLRGSDGRFVSAP